MAAVPEGEYEAVHQKSLRTRLLLDMAQHYNQGPVQLGDIARRQDISVKYLEQIVIPLKKAHFIETVRGPKGGH